MAAGAAHAAIIAEAIKASGAIVRVEPRDFLALLERAVDRREEPLVVGTYGGVFMKRYQYLTSYKGLVLYTKSPDQLVLPRGCEVIAAQQIWIPG